MLASVIPVRDRARVLGNRSIINSAVVAGSTFLLGKWLDAGSEYAMVDFPAELPVDVYPGDSCCSVKLCILSAALKFQRTK